MTNPTRIEKLVELLPTLYFRDPVLRRLLEAVAGRLAATQQAVREVMNAHWVARADQASPGTPQPPVDLPRLAALIPLVPFPDEETGPQVSETVDGSNDGSYSEQGTELFRRRLELTVEALLEGAGTAPAILKMVAATMGWGPLVGTFTEWSARWTPEEPVFEAQAMGAPGPIVLREMPLATATTPVSHMVKSGSRWVESNDSPLVVEPQVRLRALDRPVLNPTLVNLDVEVAITTLVTLERGMTLHLEGQRDGTLRGKLGGSPNTRDVSNRIRVEASGLRLDQEGATAYLRGGSATSAATLTLSNGQRALHLIARGEGAWAHGIQVASMADNSEAVALSYDPALAVGGTPRPPAGIYPKTLTLDQLLAGESRLVTARTLTFTIPEGTSHWLYFDHQGEGIFNQSIWNHTGFAAAAPEGTAPPARAPWDYATFDAAVYSPEAPRVFRFDQPDHSLYDEAVFSEFPEQVEIHLTWQRGQRATLLIDVPVANAREGQRLALLPQQLRKVKAAGVKILLSRPRIREGQPLGEKPPVVWARLREHQGLGEAARLRERGGEAQPLGERVAGVYDNSHADHTHFGAAVEGAFERGHWNRVEFV